MLELRQAIFGPWELVLILLIVVLVFGVGKLPQVGGALGKSIRNFKKSYRDEPHNIPGQVRRVEGSAEQECLTPAQERSPSKNDEYSRSKVERT